MVGRRILQNRPPQRFQTTATVSEQEPSVPEMKHIRLPLLPSESSLSFEIKYMFHILILVCVQYLNFYRTVWWLPQSFNSSGMNFYLIDFWIILIILAIEGRRLLFQLTNVPISSAITICILGICIFQTEISLHQFLYLLFPIFVHVNVHGFKPEKLFQRTEFENMIGLHICSDGSKTRQEAEELRQIFNMRIRSVLCSSFISTYYTCFIPMCFVQGFINYEFNYVFMHLILSWMLLFSFIASRSFRPEFNDACHKVACHLGRWTRLRPNHIPSNMWSGDQGVEPNGIVKHQRELYKAEGIILVSSEPGNQMHSRFQILFTKGFMTRLILGFHLSVLIILFIILLRTSEWYHVIATSTLVFTCLYTLTRLGRDFLVTWKIYEAEDVIMKHL